MSEIFKNHEQSDYMLKRAIDRLQYPLPVMGVNDYIASLTDIHLAGEIEGAAKPETPIKIKMYAFIRDQYGAKTVGGVLNSLRSAQLSSTVIDLLIEEGALVNPLEYGAAYEGYPDKAHLLDEARTRWLEAEGP